MATVNTAGASYLGGGVYSASANNFLIKNCFIQSNIALNSGGGVYGKNFTLRNCLVSGNVASTNNGGGVWGQTSLVESCTIVSNYAGVSGGGLYIDGSGAGTNNIIYYNTAAMGANNFTNTAGNTGVNYCCVFPAVDGTGNITTDPGFKDIAGGNYRLNPNSPCINRGTNGSWTTNSASSVDLDGHRRIDRFSGIVDMGAYEYFPQGFMFSVP